jgi:hypothetical protein
MAYTIIRPNGTITISDGGTNNSSTDLVLIGKNYAGYGQFLNENFVKLLDNFSGGTAPSAPVRGQLWWDSAKNILHVRNATGWKPLAVLTSDTSPPTNLVEGDLWWDKGDKQLKVYNGASFTTVGPASPASTGLSGPVAETVQDTLGSSRTIVRFYVGNSTVAIFSGSPTFTPVTAISGFPTISPGMNLATSDSVPGIQVTGTSSNSSNLSNVSGAGYMLKNQAETTTGSLSILTDLGLNIGVTPKLSLSASGSDVFVRNQANNGDLVFSLTTAEGTRNVLRINGSTGVLQPESDNNFDLGTSTKRFKSIFGVSTSALYADLAERFESDQEYAPGTVVELGGSAEVTMCVDDTCDRVFGVISTDPAYLMNDGAGDDKTHPAVALSGRVPVRVVGKVRKGDRLVSAGNGAARAGNPGDITPLTVIGRSLVDKDTDAEELIYAVVKANV